MPLPQTRTQRIQIEDVWPQLDCGRYPVKRSVGDEVEVWATIFRDGRREEATWSRAADTEAFSFKNATGDPIILDSGQTWVHVIPSEWSVTSN